MFKSLLSLGFIATTALAQSAYIGLPTAGTQLEAGANYTFQIQQPVCSHHIMFEIPSTIFGVTDIIKIITGLSYRL